MIIMIIGGKKEERLNLTKFIGKNIPNFVIRRSIYQPIKEIVSNNNKENKLSLLDENLPFIGDTTDFITYEEDTLNKIEIIKKSFDLAFDKKYLLHHFNKGLGRSQFLINTAHKGLKLTQRPYFIIDDIERTDDLLYMEENLKKICIDSNNVLGKNLFSSINKLMKTSKLSTEEKDKIISYQQAIEYEKERNTSIMSYPKILKIIIKNEDNSISQIYQGATIKTMDDVSISDNVIQLTSSDSLQEDSEKLSLLLYEILYKEIVTDELKQGA